MKKMLVWLMMVVMLLWPAAAGAEETLDMNAVKRGMEIRQLMKAHSSVGMELVYFDDYGQEFFSTYTFACLDEDGEVRLIYQDSEGNIEVLTNGLGAGFDAWRMCPYATAYILDEYSIVTGEMLRDFFRFEEPHETLVSARLIDGSWIVTTRTMYSDNPADGYQAVYYVLNGETLLLESFEEYSVDSSGSRILTATGRVTLDADYDIPADIFSIIEPAETRTVRVFIAFGDDDEKEVVFTAPAGVDLQFVYPEEYMLYEDSEMSMMYVGTEPDENGMYPEEMILYLVEIG